MKKLGGIIFRGCLAVGFCTVVEAKQILVPNTTGTEVNSSDLGAQLGQITSPPSASAPYRPEPGIGPTVGSTRNETDLCPPSLSDQFTGDIIDSAKISSICSKGARLALPKGNLSHPKARQLAGIRAGRTGQPSSDAIRQFLLENADVTKVP